MAFKRPFINLLTYRKKNCPVCRIPLIQKKTEFFMLSAHGMKALLVIDELLYCTKCKRHYLTFKKNKELVERHPGYYIDVTAYSLLLKKREKRKSEKMLSNIIPEIDGKLPLSTDNIPNNQNIKTEKTSLSAAPASLQPKKHVIDSKIYFSDLYSAKHNTCPDCGSSLNIERVNVPAIDADGNFFRYYATSVRYCYQCQKAFLTDKEIDLVLNRLAVVSVTQNINSIKLNNGIIRKQPHCTYLFVPTLGPEQAIYTTYHPSYQEHHTTTTLSVRSQSFLGKMGYSVDKTDDVRHNILDKAICKYGKRKVSDHLAFLISTRKGQDQGTLKFAYALEIWQADQNYILNCQ